jgi:hypothetical protein
VEIDNSTIARRDTQTIRYQVVYAMIGLPVSGAIAIARVSYANCHTDIFETDGTTTNTVLYTRYGTLITFYQHQKGR